MNECLWFDEQLSTECCVLGPHLFNADDFQCNANDDSGICCFCASEIHHWNKGIHIEQRIWNLNALRMIWIYDLLTVNNTQSFCCLYWILNIFFSIFWNPFVTRSFETIEFQHAFFGQKTSKNWYSSNYFRFCVQFLCRKCIPDNWSSCYRNYW